MLRKGFLFDVLPHISPYLPHQNVTCCSISNFLYIYIYIVGDPEDGLHSTTVGNQNGSFRRKYAFPVPIGGKNGSSRRKMVREKFETGDRSHMDR